MKSSIQISEFKDRCLAIIEEIAQKRRGIIVTRHGKPIARILPIDEEALAHHSLEGTLLKGFDLTDFQTGTEWDAAKD